MLEIDYGLAGSGKSRYIYKILEENLKLGKKLMILVPDQYSFITERSVLEHFGVRDGSKIKVIWFNNLARLITEEYGGTNPELLDNSGKAILMSKAVTELKDKLDFYKKQASKPDFISSLLNLSAEIKFSKTESGALLEAAKKTDSAVLQKKLEEITSIEDRYDELVNESYLNPDDALSLVNGILKENRFFDGYTVAIDGFGFFDRQKIDIITSIIEQSDNTYITLCTDNLEMTNYEGDKFSAVKKTAAKLIKAAEELGVDVKAKPFDDLSTLKPEFEALSMGIYNPSSKPFEGESERSEIIECANIYEECDRAALQIKKLIMNKGYRYKDIAVIVRDEDKYIPALKKSFSSLDIPFFKDKRRDVTHEPLMLFCHFALKSCVDNFRLDDVMSCIKSAAAGLPTEEISEFENYCIVWNINGKRKWSKDFEYNPRGFTERFVEEDQITLERINETRKKIIIPLLTFAKNVKGADVRAVSVELFKLLESIHAADNIKKLVKFSENKNSEIAEEQSAVWSVLMNCLDQLVATRGSETIELREYMGLLDLALASSNIGVIPNRIDEILVGSADRIRTDLPKAAFLLGANEGEFPKGFADGGILNDFERMSLLKQGIELGTNCTSLISQERFFAYCAALAPSEYLYISYNKSNLDGEELSASSLVKEVIRILPSVKIKDGSLITEEDVLSPEQGFEVLTKIWNKDTPLRASLYEIYSKDEKYSSKIKLIEQNTGIKTRTIEKPMISLQLFGESMAISPTQLETYSKCPFMYFCKYGLKASTPERAELDARTGGTLIHFVLENIVKELGKKGITHLSGKELKECVDKYIFIYLDKLNLPEEFISGRFKYIVSKNRAIIIATLEQMAAEMAQSDFEPSDFELKVGKDEHGEYKVGLDKGSISLIGTIDRVDTMEKDEDKYFRIIDYKTGAKKFELGEVLHGINAQMLIYLLSLSNDEGEKYSGSVPSGLLYINAVNNPISVSHGDEAKLKKEAKEKYKMNGMVLGENEVINGMEHEPSGKFIPIKVSSKGDISGNIVTREQMQRIKTKLDGIIADMGNSLHEGKIDDMPFTKSDFSACDWCDFKAVCRNKDKKNEVKVPTFNEALKELESEVKKDE